MTGLTNKNNNNNCRRLKIVPNFTCVDESIGIINMLIYLNYVLDCLSFLEINFCLFALILHTKDWYKSSLLPI